TSEKGKVTKSTPFGSVDYPFNPTSLALGSEASFVARTIDKESKHMKEMISRAAQHKGTAFLEVYQNCLIFNDGAYSDLTNKEIKSDHVVAVEHGEPLMFGKNFDKGIKLEGFKTVVVDLNDGKHTVEDLWVHDETDESPIRAFMLSHMTDDPSMPTPIGVFRQIFKPTYDEGVQAQIDHIIEKDGEGDLEDLLFSGNTWVVD
ncbi:MAG: 2-oxoacid:ferredoxin oxidoreductase subunit beta, partial [Melioribacteraceae bacterium]|nr:2-oxoacid:ferredoxin oxidoreductase subunit beta [Melioribacteraceae bacterium]